MPKQIHTLNNFSGGINNLKDPRDLSQNELANAVDVMLDKQGVIRTRGGEAGYESTINDRAATIAAGYGLAVFESDFGARTYSSTGTAGAESIDFIDKDIIELRAKADEADQFPVGSVISVTAQNRNMVIQFGEFIKAIEEGMKDKKLTEKEKDKIMKEALDVAKAFVQRKWKLWG